MSWEVVGMEGHLPADALVAWGAAALSDGRSVLNSVTRRSMSLERANDLERQGHWHRFSKPLKIESDAVDSPLVALVVNRESPLKNHFLVTTGRAGGVQVHHSAKPWARYIFMDQSAFDAYANAAAVRIAHDILYTRDNSADARTRHLTLVRYGLVIAPNDPALHALRVHLAGGSSGAVERLARVMVAGEHARARFDRLLAALRSTEEQYVLKYRGGNAEAGGFDVDVAVRALDAFSRVNKSLTPAVRVQFPFLSDVPDPRLRTLRAASAEFTFVPTVEGEALGDRVGRYLLLDLVKDALRGDPLHAAADEATLNEAVQVLAQPAPDTHLEQRPMAATELEYVSARTPSTAEEAIRSARLDCLGFVSGLKKDSTIELLLAPSVRHLVSTEKDGNGGLPIGVNAIRSDSSFLRAPCVLSLIREHTPNGAERYWLQRMELLSPGDRAVVNAAPSGVVPGAFLVGLNLHVDYGSNDVLRTGIAELSPVGGHDAGVALAWLTGFSNAVAEMELQERGKLDWLSPAKKREAPALARLLLALSDLGGEGPVNRIISKINKRFSVTLSVRSNNTRRLVLENPELLEFAGPDERRIRWTDRGKAYLDVYLAAGGQANATASAEAESED